MIDLFPSISCTVFVIKLKIDPYTTFIVVFEAILISKKQSLPISTREFAAIVFYGLLKLSLKTQQAWALDAATE